jgi:hypothetical protein
MSDETRERFRLQQELQDEADRAERQQFSNVRHTRMGVWDASGRGLTSGEITALLPEVLHLSTLPAGIYWTTDAHVRHAQIMWFVERGQTMPGWLLAEFYFGEMPLSSFKERYEGWRP